jgi:carbonic anhydrase/acetyltransferase-like protein (isoleucine patch superfamily)
VELYGDVFIGERSFVAGNTALRAAPDQRLEIGDETNSQDNVIARALEDDSTIGDETSLAHHALIRDSEIGDFAFVGFQAEVIESTVSDGALISAGSYVENVMIPENALLAPGTVVTDQATADALPTVETAEEDFKRAVLEVNAEFAEGYVELYETEGYDAVVGVGPNPETEFNPESVEPQIGADSEIGEFARVVGDVRLGAGSEVADRAAIRADEGSPIVIGENAGIDERVTFHALEETNIMVGDNLIADDDTVLHGPLEAGDNLTVGDDSVVFRVLVGDNVTVGQDVIIQGPASETEDPNELTLTILDGAVIPDGAVVTDEASLQEALSGTPQTMPDTGGVEMKTLEEMHDH